MDVVGCPKLQGSPHRGLYALGNLEKKMSAFTSALGLIKALRGHGQIEHDWGSLWTLGPRRG